jgi:hypothetical protein
VSGSQRSAERPRGEPLQVLALIFGGWFLLRALTWQSPFAVSRPEHPAPAPAAVPFAPPPGATASRAGADRASPKRAPSAIPGPKDAPVAEPLPAPWPAAVGALDSSVLPPGIGATPPARIVGQQLLLAAAFAHMELAPEIAAYFTAGRAAPGPSPALARGDAPARPTGVRPAAAGARWSGDAWLLVRNGTNGPIAAGEPSYGRSQAGAVLRYHLAPSSGHRPVAYLRATRALAGPEESEVAAGLAARPLAGLPLSVAGEVRVSRSSAGREVRPAAFAVTELPPAHLPLGLRAEAYAQAGYVGGRFGTAFVDGQARVDAPVARLGRDSEARVGGGVWGGAQKHAARLDVGPSATVSFRLGEALSRVALDYRVRVAGDAEPRSGPALTISAGF